MNNYRSVRRHSSPAGPIVAFLLIACFGLLFVTGCSSQTERPKEPDTMQDDTFTEEDMARFRELTGQQETGSSAVVLTENASDMGNLGTLRASTGSVAVSTTVDPALRKKYDAVRAMSTGNGGNLYRVTNEFVNVRAQPNVSAASAGRFVQGDIVTVMDFVNAGWAKVAMPGGKEGFLSTRYISKLTNEEHLKDEQKKFEGQYFVDFAFVNVRAQPDTKSDKLGEIPGQAFVTPLSMDKEWARVPFNGKEGYVSTQFLSPFKPNFLVRQERYQLPILHYSLEQDGMIEVLAQHVAKLKQAGVKVITFRDLYDAVLTQEVRDVRLAPRSAILAVSGLTAANVRRASDVLAAAGVPATFFIETAQVGVSGISEKTLLTLQANGIDVQSAGHTGDDLRTLTNAQTQLELGQSRALLEELTHKTVFVVGYPQGGANDRVLQQTADAGYLFGMGGAPDSSFSRDQFLRLPSYTVNSGMTADDVAKLVK